MANWLEHTFSDRDKTFLAETCQKNCHPNDVEQAMNLVNLLSLTMTTMLR